MMLVGVGVTFVTLVTSPMILCKGMGCRLRYRSPLYAPKCTYKYQMNVDGAATSQ